MWKLFVALLINVLAHGYVGAPEVEETQSDDRTGPPYHPLVLIVKSDKIDQIFDITTPGDRNVPFGSVRVQDKEPSPDQLRPDEQKLYVCSRPTWFQEIGLNVNSKIPLTVCMFETIYEHEEPHECLSHPPAIITFPNRHPSSCDSDKSMKFGAFAIQLCIPTTFTSQGRVRYRNGIKKFIEQISPSDFLESRASVEIQFIQLYQFCYNNKEKRTEWTIREVKPSPLVLRNREPPKVYRFLHDQLDIPKKDVEKMAADFLTQDFTKPYAVAQFLVPKEENSFQLWDMVTSHIINLAPLRSKFKPLIDLIDERVQRISNRLSRSVKVMTKPIYIEMHTKDYVNGNEYLEIPEMWSIQVYDPVDKSAVTIVIHTSLKAPPKQGELCQEQASCDFQAWVRISLAFDDAIKDDVMEFAYCCKTTTFSMLDDIEIEKIIDIDFNKYPENLGETPTDGPIE